MKKIILTIIVFCVFQIADAKTNEVIYIDCFEQADILATAEANMLGLSYQEEFEAFELHYDRCMTRTNMDGLDDELPIKYW
jgi:hypothetical protein